MADTYRNRIYGAYVHGRLEPMAPESIAGLRPRAAYIRRMIKSHFPPEKESRILDLGCGHGAVIHFAREAGYSNIRGVDGSRQQVDAAARLGIPNVEEGDLFSVLETYANESLDTVIAFDVIEHFTRDELIRLVDEVLRVLRKDGRWIIHAPNAESPFAARMRYGDMTHEVSFTRTSIAQLLLASGFFSVRSFEDEPVRHGVKSVLRWTAWRLIRIAMSAYIAAETGEMNGTHLFTQNFLTIAVK